MEATNEMGNVWSILMIRFMGSQQSLLKNKFEIKKCFVILINKMITMQGSDYGL